MSLSHSPSVIMDGIVFYVDAKNIRSYPGTGTTATDLIAGLSGTMTSTTFTDGYFSFSNGSGFTSSQYISFGNQSSTTLKPGGFSVMCLVNNTADISPAQPSYHRNAAFAAGSDSVLGNWSFERFRGATNWTFRMKFDQDPTYGSDYNFLAGSVSQGSWQHLAAVYNPADLSLKLYLNGILNQSYTFGSARTLVSAPSIALTIGAANTIYGFNGYFSQGIFYNRPLQASEVLQNFNAVKGRFGL